MRVGDTHPFKNALDTAILAPPTMERVEHNVRANLCKACGQVGASIQLDYFESFVPKCSGALFSTG
jgi:hypothetical protein